MHAKKCKDVYIFLYIGICKAIYQAIKRNMCNTYVHIDFIYAIRINMYICTLHRGDKCKQHQQQRCCDCTEENPRLTFVPKIQID